MYALTEPELLDEFASVYALIFFMQTLDHFAGMSLDWPMDVRALLSALVLPTSPYISPTSPYISQVTTVQRGESAHASSIGDFATIRAAISRSADL